MSNFDEWFKDYHSNNEAYAEQLTKDAFEAGAASRQAEVDCLKVELDAANERALMLLDHKNKMVDKLQGEVDELQKTVSDQLVRIGQLEKRIDDALELIYKEKSKVECGVFKGANADLIIGIGYELHLVLKGESE